MKCDQYNGNRERTVYRDRVILFLSIAANAAAAVLLFLRVQSPESNEPVVVERATAPAVEIARVWTDANEPGSTVLPWSSIESGELDILAANLRAVNCPEKTIRDLVCVRARRACAALKRNAEARPGFWSAGAERERLLREQDMIRSAETEKVIAALKRAVGADVEPTDAEPLRSFEDQAIARFFLGPMEEGKFRQVMMILQRFEYAKDRVEARAGNLKLERDRAELRQLDEKMGAQIAAVLSPAEFQEASARMVMLRWIESVRFETTDFSPAEVRDIALIHARFTRPLDNMLNGIGVKESEKSHEAELKAAIESRFGIERSAQITRARHHHMRFLLGMAETFNVSTESAVAAFEIRKAVGERVHELNSTPSIEDVQREREMSALQRDAETALRAVLGEQMSDEFFKREGLGVAKWGRL